MSVLVGITSRNRFEILPKAIQSALEQTYTPKAVSVFDDNSSDDTKLLPARFPEVKWEISSTTRGYLFARNKLMRESETDYFCSLDDDAWFLAQDELQLAVDYFENHPESAAIAFDILSPESPVPMPRGTPVETGNFIGCGHLLRLSAVKEVGYYDVFPLSYGSEEMDLCMKLIDRGYKIIFMPGVHVWHDKEQLAWAAQTKHQSGVCNDMVFFFRRAPLLFLVPGLFLKMARHLKFGIFYKKGQFLISCLKGLMKFCGQLVSFKLRRSPVSVKSFREFYRLNNTKEK